MACGSTSTSQPPGGIEAGLAPAYTADMRKLALLLLSLSLPFAAAAEMYRWVDAKGKVHYSQVKPTGQSYEKIASTSGAGPNAGAPREGLAEYASELEQSEQNAESERKQEASRRETQRRRCSEARGAQRFQKDFEGRVFSIDEKGERKPWTAEQHAQARAQVEAEIAENCRE